MALRVGRAAAFTENWNEVHLLQVSYGHTALLFSICRCRTHTSYSGEFSADREALSASGELPHPHPVTFLE